ncbi:2-hydroxyacyl-CoA dehydratase family protein [Clostridium sp.]|uniref:2-hydroxyacyl-CoA dehydratase family protein n=1 Tax=Clostridium sp. TaxID=1506 RepID=UPI003D6D9FA9
MGKQINSEPLGKFYKGGKTRTRREWRGLNDTWYDYTCWLSNWRQMIKLLLNPQCFKAFFRYRYMQNYLSVPDFLDRHTEGLRGPQLRVAHKEFDFIVAHMCQTMKLIFEADLRIGGDPKKSKKIVIIDENMMSQVMNGFPNLHAVCMQVPPIYTASTMQQNGVLHYIDKAQEFGIPGDVCPMPAAELGVALEDDYPICGICALQCNTTCDGSLMGNGIEERRYNLPTFQIAVPIRYTDPTTKDYAANEIKNAIKFIEKQTGEKFDWDHYFKVMQIFNKETEYFCDWLEISRTKYPQVVGNNVALYRDAYYQVAGGRDDAFMHNEKAICDIMMQAYHEKTPVVSEVRHRAILWGVQAQYYSAFPLWLQNCWGIVPLIDMLSLTSTEQYSTTDKEQAYYDLADLYAKENMRNRSEGGYKVGVEDLWHFCSEFDANVVIMYEHIGCKSMAGYHGLFEQEAQKRNLHLIWVTHGLMDPRKASRQNLRTEVNRYMRIILKEEPLDASLEEFDDGNAW